MEWSPPPTRIITVFCLYHLDDNIYNMNFFRQILPILHSRKIKIHYYCPKQYHIQLRAFAPLSDCDTALEIHAMCDLDGDAIFDKGLAPGWFSPLLELNIKNQKLPVNYYNRKHDFFDQLYEEFYAQFMKTYFGDVDGVTAKPRFISPAPDGLPEIYENIDILFINPPRIWDKYIIRAHKIGCKIAITTPLLRSSRSARDIPVITDAATIAAISSRSLFIVASMRNALIAPCFNERALNHVRVFYIGLRANTHLEFVREKIKVFCDENIELLDRGPKSPEL